MQNELVGYIRIQPHYPLPRSCSNKMYNWQLKVGQRKMPLGWIFKFEAILSYESFCGNSQTCFHNRITKSVYLKYGFLNFALENSIEEVWNVAPSFVFLNSYPNDSKAMPFDCGLRTLRELVSN